MKFAPDIAKTTFASPLGSITLAATHKGLAGAWFVDQRHLPDYAAWPQQEKHPLLQLAQRQLLEYLAGQRVSFDMPLDLQGGTAFQQAVWQALLRIPFGAITSYGAIGNQIGNPKAVRAVGAAVGRNPVSMIVPCHRVLGAGGALTGYAGGLARKVALLDLEKSFHAG